MQTNNRQTDFLLANLLLSVDFECLVTLLLLFDPCQVVLSTSFQRLFILWKSHTKQFNYKNKGLLNNCFKYDRKAFSNLFVTLNNILVLFQSLKKLSERPLHAVQVTRHLVFLQQSCTELRLGHLSLLRLIS